MAQVLIWIIRAYQATLSPDHGWPKTFYPHGYCRFHPSCSEYAITALETHGFWAGLFLALARLSRCHPRTAPGLDPVPSKVLSN